MLTVPSVINARSVNAARRPASSQSQGLCSDGWGLLAHAGDRVLKLSQTEGGGKAPLDFEDAPGVLGPAFPGL